MSKQIWQNLDFINISKIENLPDPISDKEAVNKSYVDNQNIVLDLKITNLDNKIENLSTLEILENTNLYFTDARVRENKLNQLAKPDGSLDLNNNQIINLADPINSQDAITLNYYQQKTPSIGLIIALG